jgi:hypothetical protein
VVYRIEGGQVSRIRSYSADCPLDAGGKAGHSRVSYELERVMTEHAPPSRLHV